MATILTIENANRVDKVRSITNPEWGEFSLLHDERTNDYTLVRMSPYSETLIMPYEFHLWEVVQFRNEQPANTTSDILSLFDSIKVENTSRISEHDRDVCDFHQQLFEQSLQQLVDWSNKFQQAEDDKPNPLYIVQYGAVREKSYCETEQIAPDEIYKQFEFSPLYGIERCAMLARKMANRFENNIIEHFNRVYRCNFESQNIIAKMILSRDPESIESRHSKELLRIKQGAAPHYNAILDYIFESMGGATFREQAEKIIMDAFRETIRKYDTQVIKGSTIQMYDWGYFKHWDRYEIDWSARNKIVDTLAAINLFSQGETTPAIMPGLMQFSQYSQNVNWGQDYEIWTAKVVAMKFFKNGRVDIKFCDADNARQFYTLYGMHSEKLR